MYTKKIKDRIREEFDTVLQLLDFETKGHDIFRRWYVDGRIYYPFDKKWAKDLIDICSAFPAGDNDDIVDTCTQAWLRLRKGWFVGHTDDYEEDEFVETRRMTLYG
jgi:phage terminase large subunit-like protein